MTDQDLKAIRERWPNPPADMGALLDEVERLRQDKWGLTYQVKGLRRRIHELEDELDGDDE